jgi:tagatose kinase
VKKIIVIGEILAEVMADTVGDGFREPMALTGPFPSGAPAIFLTQAARLGQPAAIVSAVGDDDFGRMNIDRLAREGVDVSAIRIDPDRPTGTAFVRYRADGARDFIFNIRHSACGVPVLTESAQGVLASADHLHVMGSSLTSPDYVRLNLQTAAAVKDCGGTVSFDPNVRKEMLAAPGLRDAMLQVLDLADLFLPSGDELTLLTQAPSEDEAMAELLGGGRRAVVHKRGAGGAQYRDAELALRTPAFPVAEVDPTGAGDCFGATFVSLWLRDLDPQEALVLSAAAGALAVTRRGPMEGVSDLETLRRFVGDRVAGPT